MNVVYIQVMVLYIWLCSSLHYQIPSTSLSSQRLNE